MGTQQLTVGDTLPDVSLMAHTGETVRLYDHLGEKALVLFFYPKDHTSVCTQEACQFRDSYETFLEAGAEVIGISSDSVESHQQFAQTNRLPFLLLSDPGSQVRKALGVPKTLGILPGRVTYVIDPKGVVRHVFSSQLNPEAHIREALQVLQSLG
jgi:peroxiredoxin Q/BCP